MTDNEIIKALECLRGKQTFCRECKYSAHLHYRECQQAAAQDALDLINRQKAEIERLNEVVERIQHHCRQLCILEAKQVNNIKAEAIKEFAERLKDEMESKAWVEYETYDGFLRDFYDITETHIAIDNLVKEMVGDNNG